ncbi:hypothetical protein [Nostoc sp.]|uniref:hypothetical protein n=1 Tax=Nostoc sp. TaxID=1180 RepID=UPI002FFBFA9B
MNFRFQIQSLRVTLLRRYRCANGSQLWGATAVRQPPSWRFPSIAQRKACGMASLREAAPTLRASHLPREDAKGERASGGLPNPKGLLPKGEASACRRMPVGL